MKKYVKGWYSGMRGKVGFGRKYEKLTSDFSEYSGYWTM
jgi:hypothetical protein